jgi:hypothetical protein
VPAGQIHASYRRCLVSLRACPGHAHRAGSRPLTAKEKPPVAQRFTAPATAGAGGTPAIRANVPPRGRLSPSRPYATATPAVGSPSLQKRSQSCLNSRRN